MDFVIWSAAARALGSLDSETMPNTSGFESIPSGSGVGVTVGRGINVAVGGGVGVAVGAGCVETLHALRKAPARRMLLRMDIFQANNRARER